MLKSMAEESSTRARKFGVRLMLKVVLIAAALALGGWEALRQRAEPPGSLQTPASKPTLTRAEIRIQGMDCLMCAAGLQNKLRALQGVSKAEVTYQEQRATIEFDPAVTGQDKIAKIIEGDGFKVVPPQSQPPPGGQPSPRVP
jgi:copper chaperone CopZ